MEGEVWRMFTSISRVLKNSSFLWFHDAGPPLCNTVAATHAWPFEWNTIKWKCWFPSCTSHISNAQQSMQVIARAERQRFHHYRKLFWTHRSRPFSLKETLEESNVTLFMFLVIDFIVKLTMATTNYCYQWRADVFWALLLLELCNELFCFDPHNSP